MLKGHGNNGADGREGVSAGNVIGTYLHGPLLPKNAWFADWLIATALGLPEPLPELDDALEAAAHADARRAAGLSSSRIARALRHRDPQSRRQVPHDKERLGAAGLPLSRSASAACAGGKHSTPRPTHRQLTTTTAPPCPAPASRR